jgi:hypothetical protein
LVILVTVPLVDLWRAVAAVPGLSSMNIYTQVGLVT